MTAVIDKNADFTLETAPDLPWQVSLEQLDRKTGKLCSEKEISDFDGRLNLGIGYHDKKKRNLSHSILRTLNKDNAQRSYAVHPHHLGKGAYGEVQLVQDQASKEWFALKVIHTRKNQKEIKRVNKEIQVLKANGYFEASYSDKGGDKIYVVMDLFKGPNLSKFEEKALPASRLFRISRNYLSAAHDLLKKGWRHIDHKLSNAVLESNDHVQLVDFGSAQKTNNKAKKKSLFGTTQIYLAPELWTTFFMPGSPKLPFNEKTEVYALGIALAQLYSFTEFTKVPFNRLTIKSLADIKSLQTPNFSDVQKIKLWDWLQKMTAENPEHRPSIKESMRFFEECESECLEVLGKFQTVGIVYLSELTQTNALSIFAPALRQFSKIYIVNDVNELIETHKITGKLHDEGVLVSGIITPRSNTPIRFSNIVSYLEKNKKEDVINTYIPVSAKDAFEDSVNFLKVKALASNDISTNTYRTQIRTIQAQENINEQELQIIIDALSKEKTRIENKSAEKTLEIQKVLDNLNDRENKPILKKGIVLNMLETLQNKMTHTNSVERFFEEKLGFWRDSTSKKNIKSLAETLKKAPPTAPAA